LIAPGHRNLAGNLNVRTGHGFDHRYAGQPFPKKERWFLSDSVVQERPRLDQDVIRCDQLLGG
jgi:hypothetical protein